jgi:predicted glycosyltransferase
MAGRAEAGAAGRADVLVYVQHLLGIGHLRRAAIIARALDRAGLEVVLISGGVPVPGLDLGGARLVQLPPVRALDESFAVLVEANDRPIDGAWQAARAERLCALYQALRPRALLIELFPFGRRQLRFELLPLLEAARASRPRPQILCSLRDVLSARKSPEKTAWMLDTFGRFFDLALVHGDPRFLPLERSFPEARAIADRLRYTGYVVDDSPVPRLDAGIGAGEVIVSTGGGAVAGPLVEAALGARALTPLEGATWRLLIGPNLAAAELRDIAARAPAGVIVERARPDFRALLARGRLSISQAGYNTVMEVLAAGIPAVVVPFAAGSETEQSLRARLLAERGALSVVDEAALSPETLAAAVRTALSHEARGRGRGRAGLDVSGAATTVETLRERLAIVAAQ